MNANELADYLDTFWQARKFNEASAMLRQQESEIAKLKSEIEALKSGGEAVAWMQTWRNQRNEIARGLNFDRIGKSDIALYDRPAKTLTDEEIIDSWFDVEETNCISERQIAFARAILRKAQEK